MDMYDLQAHVIGTVVPTIFRGCIPRPPVFPETLDSTEFYIYNVSPFSLEGSTDSISVWLIQIAGITSPCALGPLLSKIRVTPTQHCNTVTVDLKLEMVSK